MIREFLATNPGESKRVHISVTDSERRERPAPARGASGVTGRGAWIVQGDSESDLPLRVRQRIGSSREQRDPGGMVQLAVLLFPRITVCVFPKTFLGRCDVCPGALGDRGISPLHAARLFVATAGRCARCSRALLRAGTRPPSAAHLVSTSSTSSRRPSSSRRRRSFTYSYSLPSGPAARTWLVS